MDNFIFLFNYTQPLDKQKSFAVRVYKLDKTDLANFRPWRSVWTPNFSKPRFFGKPWQTMPTFRMFLGILQINQVQQTKLTNRNIMVS